MIWTFFEVAAEEDSGDELLAVFDESGAVTWEVLSCVGEGSGDTIVFVVWEAVDLGP